MHQPSGQQFALAAGEQRATVTEVGAGLRKYCFSGRDVLDGYEPEEMCKSGRGQLLIPWPNRIAGGAYEWDGRQLQLPLTEVDKGNAIHGLVRWSNWRVEEQESERIVLGHRLHPQPGYPFDLDLRIEYSLAKDGLTVRTTATNAGDTDAPFGAGAHPYLTHGIAPVDPLLLRIPANTVLESDERGIPVGSAPVDGGGPLDFRHERAIGNTVLDHAFTNLIRDDDGRARARLTGADAQIELWVDERYTHLMVFTGDPLPDVNRRAVAIEPMTCPPNAFATGDGVIRLEPGESVELAWGLQITPLG
jgi:aldose 1-epimerase